MVLFYCTCAETVVTFGMCPAHPEQSVLFPV